MFGLRCRGRIACHPFPRKVTKMMVRGLYVGGLKAPLGAPVRDFGDPGSILDRFLELQKKGPKTMKKGTQLEAPGKPDGLPRTLKIS